MLWPLVLAGLLLPLGGASAVTAATLQPPALEALFGGPFSLVDHNGVARSDRDFRGKYMLIYFGYITCPSICPAETPWW